MTVSKRARLILPFAVLALLAGLVVGEPGTSPPSSTIRANLARGLFDFGAVRLYPPWAF